MVEGSMKFWLTITNVKIFNVDIKCPYKIDEHN